MRYVHVTCVIFFFFQYKFLSSVGLGQRILRVCPGQLMGFCDLRHLHSHTHFPPPPFPFVADSASVVVHVINGEHPAAMQHGNSSASCLRPLPATSVPFVLATRISMTVAAVAWNCNFNGNWNWNWRPDLSWHWNLHWNWSNMATSLLGIWSWS